MNLLPYRIAAVLYGAFLAGVIYLANTRSHLSWIQFAYGIPFADKLGHLLLYGVLAFLVNVAVNLAEYQVGRWKFLTGSTVVLIVTVIEEFSQMFIPVRCFDWWDLVANGLAILAGDRMARQFLR